MKIKIKIKSTIPVAVAAALLCGAASAGETVTYKGTGTFVSTRVLLPLANGGAATHLSNDVVATLEPSQTGFVFGDCAGLGYMSAEGEYSVDAYCSFAETEEDAFAIKAKVNPAEGGSVEVIGGSGKWAGATGTGTIKPKYSEGNRGSYTYEFKIMTP
jgi:hypothetical protein